MNYPPFLTPDLKLGYNETMPIHEVLPDVYLVEIPIIGPLKVLNAYLMRGSQGWTIIDCGFNLEPSHQAWQAALAELGMGPRDIEQILVTHLHPDHFGAAGWLQQWTGAPVLMHDREIAAADRMWNPELRQSEAIGESFRSHGMPADTAGDVTRHHAAFAVQPLPTHLVPVSDGESVRLGNRNFQVLWCPGHTDGLAVFWCAEEALLLGNDMVLNKISPNIQCLPNMYPDPLDLFLQSLNKVAALPARLTLPGHRTLIHDLAGRCGELIQHHQERLRLVQELAAGGATAWEVCQGLFGNILKDTHNKRFAMAETLSHLVYLQQRGHLVQEEDKGLCRFRTV